MNARSAADGAASWPYAGVAAAARRQAISQGLCSNCKRRGPLVWLLDCMAAQSAAGSARLPTHATARAIGLVETPSRIVIPAAGFMQVLEEVLQADDQPAQQPDLDARFDAGIKEAAQVSATGTDKGATPGLAHPRVECRQIAAICTAGTARQRLAHERHFDETFDEVARESGPAVGGWARRRFKDAQRHVVSAGRRSWHRRRQCVVPDGVRGVHWLLVVSSC